MRRTLIAGGLSLLALAGAARAQPYGYYPDRGADYAYRYEPPRAYDYYGRYTTLAYGNGYDGFNRAAAAPPPDILGHAPYDQYGPDPNGLVGPDGRRIKCKLVIGYDAALGRKVTRRACW